MCVRVGGGVEGGSVAPIKIPWHPRPANAICLITRERTGGFEGRRGELTV